jgi:hypothetical protein
MLGKEAFPNPVPVSLASVCLTHLESPTAKDPSSIPWMTWSFGPLGSETDMCLPHCHTDCPCPSSLHLPMCLTLSLPYMNTP